MTGDELLALIPNTWLVLISWTHDWIKRQINFGRIWTQDVKRGQLLPSLLSLAVMILLSRHVTIIRLLVILYLVVRKKLSSTYFKVLSYWTMLIALQYFHLTRSKLFFLTAHDFLSYLSKFVGLYTIKHLYFHSFLIPIFFIYQH